MSVYVDLNVGMNRTGIASSDAFELILALKNHDGLIFEGLHAYDGHHRQTDYNEKEKAC